MFKLWLNPYRMAKCTDEHYKKRYANINMLRGGTYYKWNRWQQQIDIFVKHEVLANNMNDE